MSRRLSTTIKKTLSSNAFQIAVLVRLELNANFHLTTSNVNINYDSNTCTSSGVFMDIADIKEEASIDTGAINLKSTNASQTITNNLLTNGNIDKTVKIFLVLLNDSVTVIDTPFEIARFWI